MREKRSPNYWLMGSAAAGAIVTAVAALLLAIIATARSIQTNAARIQHIAEEIVANTDPIWGLADTDAASAKLLEGARAIEQHAREVADALAAPPSRAR